MCVCVCFRWTWALGRHLCLAFARSRVGWWVWRAQDCSHCHLKSAFSLPTPTPYPTMEVCSLALGSRGTSRQDRRPCHCLHSVEHPPQFMVIQWLKPTEDLPCARYYSNILYLVECTVLTAILWNTAIIPTLQMQSKGLRNLSKTTQLMSGRVCILIQEVSPQLECLTIALSRRLPRVLATYPVISSSKLSHGTCSRPFQKLCKLQACFKLSPIEHYIKH